MLPLHVAGWRCWLLRWSLRVLTFLVRGTSSCFFHLLSCIVWWALTEKCFFQFFFPKVPRLFFCLPLCQVIIIHECLSNQDVHCSSETESAVDGFPYSFLPGLNSVIFLATLTTKWHFDGAHKSSRAFTVLSRSLAANMKSLCSVLLSSLYTSMFCIQWISTHVNQRITPDVKGHIIWLHVIYDLLLEAARLCPPIICHTQLFTFPWGLLFNKHPIMICAWQIILSRGLMRELLPCHKLSRAFVQDFGHCLLYCAVVLKEPFFPLT